MAQGEIQSGWAPTIAAVVGTVVALLLIVARTMGLTPQTLATEGSFSNALRLVLDKPYDIATFLRDPMGTAAHPLMHAGELPRQKMLRRYRTLLVSLAKRGYGRMVFVAHSQGTVLTVTLLHEAQAPLPARVSLMTFGCPLRQLYSERFPSQYAWVKAPAEARAFVPPVTETWINLGTAGDPIGRTVFADVPEAWVEGDSTDPAGRARPRGPAPRRRRALVLLDDSGAVRAAGGVDRGGLARAPAQTAPQTKSATTEPRARNGPNGKPTFRPARP